MSWNSTYVHGLLCKARERNTINMPPNHMFWSGLPQEQNLRGDLWRTSFTRETRQMGKWDKTCVRNEGKTGSLLCWGPSKESQWRAHLSTLSSRKEEPGVFVLWLLSLISCRQLQRTFYTVLPTDLHALGHWRIYLEAEKGNTAAGSWDGKLPMCTSVLQLNTEESWGG